MAPNRLEQELTQTSAVTGFLRLTGSTSGEDQFVKYSRERANLPSSVHRRVCESLRGLTREAGYDGNRFTCLPRPLSATVLHAPCAHCGDARMVTLLATR
jgi:hypothetical protein